MKIFVPSALVGACLLLTGPVFAATNNDSNASLTPAERTKIETVVHEYLVKNPEVLVEAMQVLQRKQLEQAEQTIKKTQQTASTFATPLFHQPNDPVIGNPNGTVTIVEFFDYQCPHCVDMAPVISAIVKANPDVRVVFKEFPIRGQMSDFAARAALAANKQGKYYQLSHAILVANKPLTQDLVYELAKEQGLNVEQLKKDMNDAGINDDLKNNMKLAQDLKLFGTPAFFVGKTSDKNGASINYFPGQMNQAQLQSAVDKAKS